MSIICKIFQTTGRETMLPIYYSFDGTKGLEIRAKKPDRNFFIYADINNIGKEVTKEYARIFCLELGNTFVGIIKGWKFKTLMDPLFWAESHDGGVTGLLLVAEPGYKFQKIGPDGRVTTFQICDKNSQIRFKEIKVAA